MKTLLLPLVVLSLLAAPGCFMLAAGVGAAAGVAYENGSLRAPLYAEPYEVVAATVTAMDDLGIHTISAESSTIDGEVIGRTASDDKVTVKAQRERRGLTNLSIRIGWLGDADRSQQIYERVMHHL